MSGLTGENGLDRSHVREVFPDLRHRHRRGPGSVQGHAGCHEIFPKGGDGPGSKL